MSSPDGLVSVSVELPLEAPVGPYLVIGFDETQVAAAVGRYLETEDPDSLVLRVGAARFEVERDMAPPTTAIELDPPGPNGSNGWFVSPVALRFDAEDKELGVAATSYSLDGGPWTLFAEAVSVTTDGIHAVAYCSVDLTGNVEDTRATTFNIDSTPPSCSWSGPVTWVNAPMSATVTAFDAVSGVDTVSLALRESLEYVGHGGSLSVPVDTEGRYNTSYWATDVAGNGSQPEEASFGLDFTPPSVSAISDRDPNNWGWYNDPIRIDFQAEDPCLADESAGSGVDWTSPPITLQEEGLGLRVSGCSRDVAGNRAEVWTELNLDFTPPCDRHRIDRSRATHGRGQAMLRA
jgi:hypothetical protein